MTRYPLFAREGWPFIAGSLAIAIAITFVWGWLWAAPWWLIAIFCIQFFRDPTRRVDAGPNDIVCPADGKVIFVGKMKDPYLDREVNKISVFMNVFNVHSNKSPVNGVIKKRWYRPGSFVNAAFDKAAEENEQNALWITTDNGLDITCVQIAGLVARRILCYVDEGDTLQAGQRYGFIRFGSRVDLYLPDGTDTRVSIGDTVKSGLDILAVLPEKTASTN
jgi:phosphatidylserine decarboxylase